MPLFGVPLFRFHKDLWHQKTRVSVLSFGVICIFLCLAVLVVHWHETDGQKDTPMYGHRRYHIEQSSHCNNSWLCTALHTLSTTRTQLAQVDNMSVTVQCCITTNVTFEKVCNRLIILVVKGHQKWHHLIGHILLYFAWDHLCVCLSIRHRIPTLLHALRCNFGER